MAATKHPLDTAGVSARGQSDIAHPAPDRSVRTAAGLSRRDFLRLTVLSAAGGVIFGPGQLLAGSALVIASDSRFVLLADPHRCVGCGRCELVCTELNDGVAQPAMSRIRIMRNLAFGPDPFKGPIVHGVWGDGLIVQDACKQCPAPVPCAEACPNEAIFADPTTGARTVDVRKCVGCRQCLEACPWSMMTFNEADDHASKCFLCHGRPKCVEACPAGALSLIPWRDLR